MVKLALAASVIMLFSIMTGCEDAIQDPPDDSGDDPRVNPNPPNANEMIVHQTLIGDADEWTSIWHIIDSGDGAFYFRGFYRDRYALGKLDDTGQEEWIYRSKYSVRDIVRLSGFSGDLANSLLSVGGYDSDIDGETDTGYVTLLNSAGNVIDELTFSVDAARVWLHAVAVSETSDTLCHLLAAGRAEMAGILYPYVARFTVSSDGTMQNLDEMIFLNEPTMYFDNVLFDFAQSPSVCYLSGGSYSDDTGYGNQTVYRLSEVLEIAWSADIVPEAGLQSWTSSGSGLLHLGNQVFLAGTTDIAKENNPSGGEYWEAAVVACVSTDGSVDWVRTVALSQYSESSDSCYLSDNILYVTGRCSSHLVTDTKARFGNALLLKVDPESGDVLSDLSFGSEHYASGFNDIIVRGGRAFAVGYTNARVVNGPYQGWFVVIDLNVAPVVARPSIEVPGPARDRQPRDRRHQWGGPSGE